MAKVAYSFGSNNYGQFGVGDTATYSTAVPFTALDLNGATVRAGNGMVVVLMPNGDLYSWGYNYQGQLGVGDTVNRSAPTLVMAGVDKFWVYAQQSSSATAVFARKTTGELYIWGTNLLSPTQISGSWSGCSVYTDEPFLASNMLMIRSSSGALYRITAGSSSITQIAGVWTDVTSFGTGTSTSRYTCAIKDDGYVYYWAGTGTPSQLCFVGSGAVFVRSSRKYMYGKSATNCFPYVITSSGGLVMCSSGAVVPGIWSAEQVVIRQAQSSPYFDAYLIGANGLVHVLADSSINRVATSGDLVTNPTTNFASSAYIQSLGAGPISTATKLFAEVNGVFLRGGAGYITKSSDAKSWDLHIVTGLTNFTPSSIRYDPVSQVYLMGGAGLYVRASADLLTWSTPSGFNYQYVNSVLYLTNGSAHLRRIQSGLYAGKYFISTDELTWRYVDVSIAGGLTVLGTEFFRYIDGVTSVSVDGVTWQTVSSNLNNLFTAGAYSPSLGLYVLVGADGMVLTSTDRRSWAAQSSGAGASTLNSVTWVQALGLFVAVGTLGVVITSSDGLSWVSRGLDTTSVWNTVLYSPLAGRLLVAGQVAKVLTSDNGVLWVEQGTPGGFVQSGAYDQTGARFVLTGSSGYSSATGLTGSWTSHSYNGSGTHSGAYYSAAIRGVVSFATGTSYIGALIGTTVFNISMYSSTYNSTHALGTPASSSSGVHVYPTQTSYGTIFVMRDGGYYGAVPAGVFTNGTYKGITAVAHSALLNRFVALTDDNSGVMVSSDGLAWSYHTKAINSAANTIIWVPGLNKFFACGVYIESSSDGLTWTNELTTPVSYAIRSSAYSPSLGVVLYGADSGYIYTSSNGYTLTQLLVGTEALSVAIWSDTKSKFYVTSSSNQAPRYFYSSDGAAWSINPFSVVDASEFSGFTVDESDSKSWAVKNTANVLTYYYGSFASWSRHAFDNPVLLQYKHVLDGTTVFLTSASGKTEVDSVLDGTRFEFDASTRLSINDSGVKKAYINGYQGATTRVAGYHPAPDMLSYPESSHKLFLTDFGVADISGVTELLSSDSLTVANEYMDAADAYSGGSVIDRSASDSVVVSTENMNSGLQLTEGDLAQLHDSVVHDVVQWFFESVIVADSEHVVLGANVDVLDRFSVAGDVVYRAFYDLVASSVDASEDWFIEPSVHIIELISALDITTRHADVVATVAKLIVAIDLVNSGKVADALDTVNSISGASFAVAAVADAISQAVATLDAQNHVLVFSAAESISHSSTGADGALIAQNALTDGAVFVVNLYIDGDVYAGWAINTQSGAVTEYQGLAYNAVAKIGDKYFATSDYGVHELGGDSDNGRAIASYIQSDLIDFGTDHEKGMGPVYLAVSADDRLALGVSTVNDGKTSVHWYSADTMHDGVENTKIPVGKGLRGRYFRFSVASEGLKSFTAMSITPLVLSRKV